jgi:hypothetical protein
MDRLAIARHFEIVRGGEPGDEEMVRVIGNITQFEGLACPPKLQAIRFP